MSGTPRRPMPRSRLLGDPDNVYAQLGVSPLAAIDEIKAVLNTMRRKALDERRDQDIQKSRAAEARMRSLQDIEQQIGTVARRAAYDAEHPQNELLTVQPSARDRAFTGAERFDIVTAWLFEELGSEAGLASPLSLEIVAPAGLDAELVALLAPFEFCEEGRLSEEPQRVSLTVAEIQGLRVEDTNEQM